MRVRNVFVAAVALMLLATVASAATVTYSTTGTFTSTGTATTGVIAGGISITYTGQASTTVGTPASVDLGEFLTAGSPGPSTFSDTFTLNIVQTLPAGGGSFVGSVSGTLTVNSGIVTVDFAPQTLTINGIIYTLANDPMVLNVPSNGTPSDVRALVAVPLPSAAWAGMSLLGAIGAFRIRKSMRA